MKANYEKLKEFLENGLDSLELTIGQIEMIIGLKLSETFKSKKTINEKDCEFRMAAEKAGFQLSSVDHDCCKIVFKRLKHTAVNGEELSAENCGSVGNELDSSMRLFKNTWGKTGYVPFCNKYSSLDDVYFNAGMEAYRAAMRRAIKLNGLSHGIMEDLRRESCEYLAGRFKELFEIKNLDFDKYDAWAEETTKHIREIYRDQGVNDYTIGNAQKIINVALKFVMSSDLVDYNSDVFKYCHFPVDGIIQGTIKRAFKIKPLETCWSKNDNWEDFLGYQKSVREAVHSAGYYSPIVWEATHWN